MIGRAGRPQFDTSAIAVIMCQVEILTYPNIFFPLNTLLFFFLKKKKKKKEQSKWENLCSGSQLIESTLLDSLAEHLNSEAVSGVIANLVDAIECKTQIFSIIIHIHIYNIGLKSTYLYVRASQNPSHYGISKGLSLFLIFD